MSGMNALSGITILGAITAVGLSVLFEDQSIVVGQILGGLAVVAATVNVVGGFGVTHRMLKMFDKKKKGGDK
jgi:NAD(P) transhydrogenase subunit alpha